MQKRTMLLIFRNIREYYQKEQVQNKVYLIRKSTPAHRKKVRTKWNIFHLFRNDIFPTGISLSQKDVPEL